MKHHSPLCLFALLVMLSCHETFIVPAHAATPLKEWKHQGSLFILTTPQGANLPAGVTIENFPVLIRLHKDWFDFSQAQPHGEDLRLTASENEPLAFQIEDWNPTKGEASIWVRVPRIEGNARQELKLHWGHANANAKSESAGSAVFNKSNGYVSVWHLGASIDDEVGTLKMKDVDTTITDGMIGKARHLAGKQGLFGGDNIPNYPSGGDAHSTETWFRAQRPNVTLIGWGNEPGGRGTKVRMQLRSPPHLHIDSNFSDVDAPQRLPMNEWIHVVHTYENSISRLYVNGKLAGEAKPTLKINTPARLWLGGWYHNYDFVGDLDEARISSVARSPHWIRLQHENQKPMQTLVGSIVASASQPNQMLSVSQEKLSVAEGKSVTVTAKAPGAQKIYWMLKRGGQEEIVAVDRLSYAFDAGRVAGDDSATLTLRAVYPSDVKTKEIPITIKEAVEDPMFSLKAPQVWDGRKEIQVNTIVPNLAAMQSLGAGDLQYTWSVSGPAVIKAIAPGQLILKRAMGSGPLIVTLALSNGGTATTQQTTIEIREPASDTWIHQTPGKSERVVDGQFIGRDDTGMGTLHFSGTLDEAATSVFLRVYEGDKQIVSESQKVAADKTYTISAKIKAGLVKYRVEFGAGDKVLHAASDVMCGDAYLIIGQSNAVATDWGKDDPPPASEWVRTFGSTSGGAQESRLNLWATAQAKAPGGKSEIGYWGVVLGKKLVESQRVPICIINGAVGGTRIDQHQRNMADPTDTSTIYGRLLWRVREAGLTHAVRGILWHQGENDQGADGPTGGFGWETYRLYFHELAGAWKQDYPNLQHIHLFQIWPKSCSMGVNGSDNALREVQRTLPRDFSRMSIMSTLGISPPGGCHYPAAGYAEFARLIAPLIERDHYGKTFKKSITPPNLLTAAFSGDTKQKIVLTFDQPVIWHDKLASQFYLDGISGNITAGTVKDNTLTLNLSAPSQARQITYLDSKAWSQDLLLVGANDIAALTFYNVPIESEK